MFLLDAFGCLPYRQGVPLSAFGMLGYFAVAALALVPLKLDDEAVDKSTRSLLLVSVCTTNVRQLVYPGTRLVQ